MIKNKRRGCGYSWSLDDTRGPKTGFTRSIRGFTVDHLDKKKVEEANNDYERVFILIRETLEKNNAACCDEEKDRLNLCQEISDILSENRLISKGGE